MQTFPLRFRRLDRDTLVFANEAGRFFRSDAAFLDRLDADALTAMDQAFLLRNGFACAEEDDLAETAFLHALASRLRPPGGLRHVILVPTLRCDLACSYCQVSRAALNARGHDWTDETLAGALDFLGNAGGDDIQIEFQGGEPTLRLDLLEAVTDFCRRRFARPQFVLCTNLSRLDAALERFIAAPDVLVSTSLDGPQSLHRRQRTQTRTATNAFFTNLERAKTLCAGRLDALPTLDPATLPMPGELLDAFDALGLRSLFLRPVAYHGFARRTAGQDYDARWRTFYDAVIAEMIARNAAAGPDDGLFEEFSLTLALKRLLRPGADSYADLRSPAWLGYDHVVVDYDGALYPTDEARMLARIGVIDLAMGHVASGLDVERRRALQGAAFNALDPWCAECPYQAACGSDPIDAIARAGRADAPRPLTAFCQRQTHLFDTALALIYSPEPAVQNSLAGWLKLPHPVPLGLMHA